MKSVTYFIFILLINTITSSYLISQTIKLDDFELENIREINPNESELQIRFLWSQYTNEDKSPGISSLTTNEVYSGIQSLRTSILDGDIGDFDVQFRPKIDNTVYYMKEFVSGSWQNNAYNRLKFWVKLPEGVQLAPNGQGNAHFGTYTKATTSTNLSSYESDNGHWYHILNLPYTGEWHQVVIDMHPNTQRGTSGNIEIGNQHYPTNESDLNYFDTLTRFYFTLFYGNMNGEYPADLYLDNVELYHENNTENEEQVYSLNGVYIPSSNQFYLGWMRNKDENSIKHEIRFAYVNIHLLQWENATPAPNGLVSPLGWQGYNGMQYITDQIDTGNNSLVYFAIKPENSDLFKQIAIPVKKNGKLPPLAINDYFTSKEDEILVFNVLANDADPDGTIDSSSVRLLQLPQHGMLNELGYGQFTYIPHRDFFGKDTLMYQFMYSDTLQSNIASVYLNILPVNDPPAPFWRLTPEDNTLQPIEQVSLSWSTADDVDGDVITYFVSLGISGNDTTFSLQDTTVVLDLSDLIKQAGEQLVSWSVIASDSYETVFPDNGPGVFRTELITGVQSNQEQLPQQHVLYGNYPNPFNPFTTIRYGVATKAKVRLTIFNVLGVKVFELVNMQQQPGNYTISWTGIDTHGKLVPSGVYIIWLQINDGRQINTLSQKIMLLK